MRSQFLAKDKKYYWTNHALQKMRFYRLTESRIKKVLRSPQRVEEGVALGTVASMQPSGNKKRAEEIWVMWQKKIKNKELRIKNGEYGKITIISAWRYPGTSPAGKPIKIPEDILEDLRNSGLIE